MALTRQQFERVLVKRAGAFLTQLGLSTDVDGTNEDLADPISVALSQADYAVDDITEPSAVEIAAVTSADTLKVLDLAELRLLETLLSSNTLVDITVGPHSERLGQLRDGLSAAIKAKRESIAIAYEASSGGWGTVTLTSPDCTTEYTA